MRGEKKIGQIKFGFSRNPALFSGSSFVGYFVESKILLKKTDKIRAIVLEKKYTEK